MTDAAKDKCFPWSLFLSEEIGTGFLATLAFNRLARRIEVAKINHFDSAHDRLAWRSA